VGVTDAAARGENPPPGDHDRDRDDAEKARVRLGGVSLAVWHSWSGVGESVPLSVSSPLLVAFPEERLVLASESIESFRVGLPFTNSNRLFLRGSDALSSSSVVMMMLSKGLPPDSGMNRRTDMVFGGKIRWTEADFLWFSRQDSCSRRRRGLSSLMRYDSGKVVMAVALGSSWALV